MINRERIDKRHDIDIKKLDRRGRNLVKINCLFVWCSYWRVEWPNIFLTSSSCVLPFPLPGKKEESYDKKGGKVSFNS